LEVKVWLVVLNNPIIHSDKPVENLSIGWLLLCDGMIPYVGLFLSNSPGIPPCQWWFLSYEVWFLINHNWFLHRHGFLQYNNENLFYANRRWHQRLVFPQYKGFIWLNIFILGAKCQKNEYSGHQYESKQIYSYIMSIKEPFIYDRSLLPSY